jgi:tRNA dimethylallyltransferase
MGTFNISELKIPVICGPTAAGKSAVALMLAQQFGYEIISADSRQMVKGMDIGTAKPTQDELKLAPHHFIDIIEPEDEIYNSYMYGNEVRDLLSKLCSEGKKAIICGGSGLYIHSAVHGFFEDLGIDDSEKFEYRKILERTPLSELYEKLRSADPEYAEITPATQKQRIHRALEVFHFTGRKISDLHSEHQPEQFFHPVYIGLNSEREILFENINSRVIKMVDSGLVGEVEGLVEKYGSELKRFKKTIGYKEVVEYLKGDITKDRMIELIQTNTRHFAKRQITWFKRIPEMKWFDPNDLKIIKDTFQA